VQKTTRVAAYGLMVVSSKILLCRISSKLPQYEGQWTLPGGGIEFGETPEQAVIREVQEETGFLVQTNGLANVHSDLVNAHDRVFHAIRILYHTKLLGGDLAYEVDGTTDRCEWFTQANAQRLDLVQLARLGLTLAFPQ